MHDLISFLQYLAKSNTINFIIMVALLCWIASKINLSAGFDKSIENVKSAIKKSDEAVENSNKNLTCIKKEMKKLPAEIEKIEAETQEKAQNLKKQIEISTNKSVENIAKSASKVLDIEEKKVRAEIFNETIENSVAVAEANIIDMLKSNPDLHNQFIEDSLNELDKVSI